MTIVRTAIGVTPYAVTATAGRHTLTLDEPVARGGQDAGVSPYDAVLAGLGACSAITLRMYAERKQLAIRSLSIELSFHREADRGVIQRVVHLDAELTPEQRARFADIVERTPVTLTLKAGNEIRTEFR
jgi:putative redox protein